MHRMLRAAIGLLSMLTACVVVSREQQLQAAREKVWAVYGGKDAGACTQAGAQRVGRPIFPLQFEPRPGASAVAAAPANPEGAQTLEAPELRGSLSKAVIQKRIRSHIGEVRRCYETGLSGWTELSGRVAVKFIIEPDGRVYRAVVADTTLHNRPVECCILDALSGWTFPEPVGGGIVVVTYPFVLEQSP